VKIMMINSSGCCGGSTTCCQPQQTKKEIAIDFLYLDLTTCERCQGAESNLDGAIKDVSHVLNAAGYDLKVNKVNISSEELAKEYKFLSSPTIRINGVDIALEVKESECKDCGDICGDSVDCRVWEYDGLEYTEPPKEMIVNAFLKAVYGGQSISPGPQTEYTVPENLRVFFAGLKNTPMK
jgi:uncharacterized protein (UPF0335 family)